MIQDVRVTEKGQVTIPKHIRDELGICAGTDLEFSIEDGTIVARKVPGRGQRLVERARGTGSGTLSTDEIMAMTRGHD